MPDEKVDKTPGGGVAESSGDTDIDQLLRAQREIQEALSRHKAQLTVLFTDIVGSTSFFEKFGDTAGLMMLQRHDELVMPAIKEAGGNVVKTIGDAVLAVFTSPVTAVKSGIKIQQRLDAFNEDRPQQERIYTRVGLNFGTGFVKEKDVFGDVVNVAARFVKTCLPAQILVSKTVYEAIKNEPDVTCRKVGSEVFHGKSAAEDMYEVMWTSPERYDQLRKELDSPEGASKAATARNALGPYEILEELGRGAMGVVYKGHDPVIGRMVALKTVRLDATGPERNELISRLRTEAQAAGRLEHRNIVTIYGAGEAEGLFYVAMQFVKGRMLAQLITDRTQLPIPTIVGLMEQVCEGLHYAHERNIVHRDLKPANIVVTPEGIPKVLDFGIAKVAETGTTKAGTVLGTPSYMSPEQASGGRVDRRTDVWALGAILYELLSGEKAFPGNTPTTVIYKILNEKPIPLRSIEPLIDPRLEKFIVRALDKDPFKRYQTCEEMRKDLAAYRSGKPEAAGEVAVEEAGAEELEKTQAFAEGEEEVERTRLAAPPPPTKRPPPRAVAPPPRPRPPIPVPARASKAPWIALSAVVAVLAVGSLVVWKMGWVSLGPSGPTKADTKALLDQASIQLVAEQFDDARKLIEQVLAVDPANDRALGLLAKTQRQQADKLLTQANDHIRQSQYAEAGPVLDKILAIDPNNQQAKNLRETVMELSTSAGQTREEEVLLALAQDYINSKQYGLAEDIIRKALSKSPRNKQAQNLLAKVQQQQKQQKKDRDDLLGQAEDSIARGQYEKARDLVEKVDAIDPRNKRAQELLARIEEGERTQKAGVAQPTSAPSAPAATQPAAGGTQTSGPAPGPASISPAVREPRGGGEETRPSKPSAGGPTAPDKGEEEGEAARKPSSPPAPPGLSPQLQQKMTTARDYIKKGQCAEAELLLDEVLRGAPTNKEVNDLKQRVGQFRAQGRCKS